MGLFNFLFNVTTRKTNYVFDSKIFEDEEYSESKEIIIDDTKLETKDNDDDIDFIIDELSKIEIDSIIDNDDRGHE